MFRSNSLPFLLLPFLASTTVASSSVCKINLLLIADVPDGASYSAQAYNGGDDMCLVAYDNDKSVGLTSETWAAVECGDSLDVGISLNSEFGISPTVDEKASTACKIKITYDTGDSPSVMDPDACGGVQAATCGSAVNDYLKAECGEWVVYYPSYPDSVNGKACLLDTSTHLADCTNDCISTGNRLLSPTGNRLLRGTA